MEINVLNYFLGIITLEGESSPLIMDLVPIAIAFIVSEMVKGSRVLASSETL